jgi:hypothetical protein
MLYDNRGFIIRPPRFSISIHGIIYYENLFFFLDIHVTTFCLFLFYIAFRARFHVVSRKHVR